MERVYVSLGTNMGDREATIASMEKRVFELLVGEIKSSLLMETQPVDVLEVQQWYLNKIISGYYRGNAHELLTQCQEIETILGRTRIGYHASRTADIDIVLFGKLVITTASLTIPHPAIAQRRYLIEGICQIDACAPIAGLGSAAKVRATLSPGVAEQKVIFTERGS